LSFTVQPPSEVFVESFKNVSIVSNDCRLDSLSIEEYVEVTFIEISTFIG